MMKLKISSTFGSLILLLILILLCQLATSSPRADKKSKKSAESESDEDESSSSEETIYSKHRSSDKKSSGKRKQHTDEDLDGLFSFLPWALPSKQKFEKSSKQNKEFSNSESSESESDEEIVGWHSSPGIRKSNHGRKSKGGKKSSSESSESDSKDDSKSETSSESFESDSESDSESSESKSWSQKDVKWVPKSSLSKFKNFKSKDGGWKDETELVEKANFKITPQYIAEIFLKYRTDLKNKLDEVLPHCPEVQVDSVLKKWGIMFKNSWPNFTKMAKKSLGYANELKSQLLACLKGILKNTTNGFKNIFAKNSNIGYKYKGDGEDDEVSFKLKREAIIDAGTFQENFHKEYISPILDHFEKLPEMIQAIDAGKDDRRR